MKVTILVPVYGVEKYIAECVESLFQQTYPNLEYVFCDDCTPDRSIEVLRSVMEKYPQRKDHVRIIRNDKNTGIGGTRAQLLSEVETDCFFFADSDDVLPLNAIELLVKRMKDADTDIVEGAHANYNNGEISSPFLTFHGKDKDFCRRILCQNVEANRVWGRLYKISVLEKLPDMFFEGIDYCEDYCAVARLSAVTTRSWIDDVVYWYRTDNTNSYTKNVSKKASYSYLKANGKVWKFYKRRGECPLALEVGMLNAYRECHKSGIPIAEADEIMGYSPQSLATRIISLLFHNRLLPYTIIDYSYRLLRTISK